MFRRPSNELAGIGPHSCGALLFRFVKVDIFVKASVEIQNLTTAQFNNKMLAVLAVDDNTTVCGEVEELCFDVARFHYLSSSSNGKNQIAAARQMIGKASQGINAP
jgi:hypothetical protein